MPKRTNVIAGAALAAWVAVLGSSGTALADSADADRLFKAGDWDAAATAYEELAEATPADQQAWYRLGYSLHALGRYETALVAHETAARLAGPATATAAYNAACAGSKLGRADDACRWLAQAASAGFGSAVTLDCDPDLDGIRDDPRFLAVRNPLADATLYRSFRGPSQQGDARQFDFWLGDWESVNFSRAGSGGWSPAGALETRVTSALDGNAIVEWSATTQPGGPTQGFSIRTFDPGRNEWLVLLNWPSPGSPSFSFLSGRFRHGRCELMTPPYGASGSGQTRFTFSDASPDGYRWDSAATKDSGASWSSTLLFEARRKTSGEPLTTGPSHTNDHCPGPEFRSLDFLLGDWVGARAARTDAESEPVRLHCYSVMEGSALVEEEVVGVGDGRRESFAIQCYEPQRKRWVRYTLGDGAARRFLRHEATAGTDGVTWMPAPGPGSSGAPESVVVGPTGKPGAVGLTRSGRSGDETLWTDRLTRE